LSTKPATCAHTTTYVYTSAAAFRATTKKQLLPRIIHKNIAAVRAALQSLHEYSLSANQQTQTHTLYI